MLVDLGLKDVELNYSWGMRDSLVQVVESLLVIFKQVEVLGSEEKEPELNSGVLLLIITNEGVLILD